ncbi:hypothetical protein HDU76_012204 [Blyttiomyces sp. JEL0837]|nr:hypothetical protein HDU76_012204 [Blyttiomyces sp. JEL0837]
MFNDETDLKYLNEIEKDVNEPWHFRIQAANSISYILKGEPDEERGAKKVCKMMEICKEALNTSSREYINSTVIYNVDTNDPRDMLELTISLAILEFRSEAQSHLLTMLGTWETYILNGEPRSNNSGLSDHFGKAAKVMKAPFLPSMSCGGCGTLKVTETDDPVVMMREPLTFKFCSKCERFAYCSRECQILHWKERGHKELCREIGDFQVGDFVEVFGLVGRKDLEGLIAEVVKDVTKEDGVVRFAVESCLQNTKPFQVVVKPENLRLLLSVEEGERL